MRNILYRYLWLVRTIKANPGITFSEISKKWSRTTYSEGNPLPRRTFLDWKNNVEDLFDIEIICKHESRFHCYYLKTLKYDGLSSIDDWLLSSIGLSVQLADAKKMHERVQLEHIPSGEQFLLPMIEAMKKNRAVKISYQKFVDEEAKDRLIEPYCVKVFEKRWYVVGRDAEKDALRTFALDRIKDLTVTQDTFRLPRSFSVKKHFRYSYGIYGGSDLKPEKIVVRAYGTMRNYLRTLPAHPSQEEVNNTAEHSDFAYKMAVSYDFRQYLLAQGPQLEVLEPASLREDMKSQLMGMLKRYDNE